MERRGLYHSLNCKRLGRSTDVNIGPSPERVKQPLVAALPLDPLDFLPSSQELGAFLLISRMNFYFLLFYASILKA